MHVKSGVLVLMLGLVAIGFAPAFSSVWDGYASSLYVSAETVYATAGTPTTYFAYDGDRVVEEVDDLGNVVASYVYGQYVDEVLQMRRGASDYYYLHDDQYNVLGLADATGAVVERYTYDDYGAPTVWVEDDQNPGTWVQNTTATGAPVSSVGNPFMFTGRRWDEVLALYDYRTRYYNPYLGRFLRIDTIGLWGDANNLGNPYAYVGNNPWSRLDPYGLQMLGIKGAAENADLLNELGLTGQQQYADFEGTLGRTSGAIRAATSFTTADAHAVLDALGMVPGLGIIFDATNGAWYYVEGDSVSGTISVVSAIPGVGDIVGAAKVLGSTAGGVAVYKTIVRGKEYYYLTRKAAGGVAEAKPGVVRRAWNWVRGVDVAAAGSRSAANRGAGWFEDIARNATRNPDSDKVVFGHFAPEGSSYQKVAAHYNATYFKVADWKAVTKGLSQDEIWRINETFITQQIRQGKQILFSHDPLMAKPGSFFEREVNFMQQLGFSFRQRNQWTWEAVR
jgi:RHS repeat-associated protein